MLATLSAQSMPDTNKKKKKKNTNKTNFYRTNHPIPIPPKFTAMKSFPDIIARISLTVPPCRGPADEDRGGGWTVEAFEALHQQ